MASLTPSVPRSSHPFQKPPTQVQDACSVRGLRKLHGCALCPERKCFGTIKAYVACHTLVAPSLTEETGDGASPERPHRELPPQGSTDHRTTRSPQTCRLRNLRVAFPQAGCLLRESKRRTFLHKLPLMPKIKFQLVQITMKDNDFF